MTAVVALLAALFLLSLLAFPFGIYGTLVTIGLAAGLVVGGVKPILS